MTVSENGWPLVSSTACTSITVPGGKLPVLRGDVAVVFAALVKRYHIEVEQLRWPGCWGYAPRPIRGSTVPSNHASGTAVDLNAPQHNLGDPASKSFTPAQIAACHRLVADFAPVIRWGGDYSGRKDSMHWEIIGSAAQVAALAKRLTSTTTQGDDDMTPEQSRKLDACYDELTKRLPNRVAPGQKQEGTGTDTLLGYATNADAYGVRIERYLHSDEFLDRLVAKLRAAK